VTAAAVLARNSRAAHGPTTPPRKFSGFHYEKGSSRGANLFSPNSFPPIGLQHLAQSASGRRCVFHHSAHTWRLPSRARHSPFRACWFGLRAEPWRFHSKPDADGLEFSRSPVSTPVWLTGCASRRPDLYVFESGAYITGWSGCGRSETRRRDYRRAEGVVGGHLNAFAPGNITAVTYDAYHPEAVAGNADPSVRRPPSIGAGCSHSPMHYSPQPLVVVVRELFRTPQQRQDIDSI